MDAFCLKLLESFQKNEEKVLLDRNGKRSIYMQKKQNKKDF